MRTIRTFLLVLSLGACTRSVPASPPPASAASLDGAGAPPAVMAHALRGDPPLPGEPTAGWEGLEPTTHGAHGHAH